MQVPAPAGRAQLGGGDAGHGEPAFASQGSADHDWHHRGCDPDSRPQFDQKVSLEHSQGEHSPTLARNRTHKGEREMRRSASIFAGMLFLTWPSASSLPMRVRRASWIRHSAQTVRLFPVPFALPALTAVPIRSRSRWVLEAIWSNSRLPGPQTGSTYKILGSS